MTNTTLPVIRIENTGTAQTSIPFTFGQVFKVGALKQDATLAAKTDSVSIPLQVDYKATHGDGSVRHAIVSGILPSLDAGATATLQLVEVKAYKSKVALPAVMPDTSVEITIDGVLYSTKGSKFGDVIEWLSGPAVAEVITTTDLLGPDSKQHPHLTVRAGIRAYASGQLRVEVVVENNKTFAAGARNYTYKVAVKLAGVIVFEQESLTHYHHARWHKTFWMGSAPEIHIVPDTAYLIATKAIPNYDQSVVPNAKSLDTLRKKLTEKNTALMGIGPLASDMGSTGGRPDIGPLPSWCVSYLLSGDIRAREVMIAAAEGSGSWSTHYRDEETGYPVRTDNEKNRKISTHPNMGRTGPLPVPRLLEGNSEITKSPYSRDTAHQPSLTYLPYLLTGEHYYLEELQFWASMNPLGTDSGNSGQGLGLVRWQQLRGQAWSLRTLGHAAFITPDAHPLKDYFTSHVQNNIDFYHKAYVEGNPNNLGAYDGSGERSFKVSASAPWQDDYLTWSFAHLVELGFSSALPVFQWKSKYAIGRMTAAGFCWIQAASYHMKFRDDEKSPIYETFSELYQANFSGDKVWHEGKTRGHEKGLKYIDQPCGSQAQADWLGDVAGYGWKVGQMVGYAASTTGYPANMQPALAVAVDMGAPGSLEAWEKFDNRKVKPDYSTGPQFAIVPRSNEEVPHGIELPAKNIKAFYSQIVIAGELVIHDPTILENKKYTIIVMEE